MTRLPTGSPPTTRSSPPSRRTAPSCRRPSQFEGRRSPDPREGSATFRAPSICSLGRSLVQLELLSTFGAPESRRPLWTHSSVVDGHVPLLRSGTGLARDPREIVATAGLLPSSFDTKSSSLRFAQRCRRDDGLNPLGVEPVPPKFEISQILQATATNEGSPRAIAFEKSPPLE